MNSKPNTRGITRRDMLRSFSVAGCSALYPALSRGDQPDEEPAATHNWMLVGVQTAFLSHLPMFEQVNQAGTEYDTPHRFQVILQVSLGDRRKPLEPLYFADRRSHPAITMFTVSPARNFVLPQIAPPTSLKSFEASVLRGHLERGGKVIPGLAHVPVNIEKVVHFHKFDPAAQAAGPLEYYLFGRGPELFVAHSIVKPPDFDQILSVTVTGSKVTDAELGSAMRISIPQRKNTVADRLIKGESVTAEASDGRKLLLRSVTEFYFEEGELRMPATFDPTPAERRAGFG